MRAGHKTVGSRDRNGEAVGCRVVAERGPDTSAVDCPLTLGFTLTRLIRFVAFRIAVSATVPLSRVHRCAITRNHTVVQLCRPRYRPRTPRESLRSVRTHTAHRTPARNHS